MAVFKVQAGEITVGDFVLINAFMMQLFMPLNFLGFVYREIKTALVNIEKLFSLLSREGQVADKKDSKPLNFKLGQIKFEDVLAKMMVDSNRLAMVSSNAFSLVDGCGTTRVCDAVYLD